MKLSKQEITKIAREYNLGKIKSFKPFAGGWINYNYELETEKGKFVIRVLGLVKKYTYSALKEEFKVLTYLHQRNFPYGIPYPLKNNRQKYLTKIGGKILWIYPKIEGNQRKHYNINIVKSMVRALATYHKYVESVKVNINREHDSPEKLLRKYKLMKQQKPDSNRNKIMLDNIELFKDILNKVKGINFYIKQLPVHYDFHKGNFLFKGNNVVGILDFERMLYAPRILDLAYLIKTTYENGKPRFRRKVNLIIKEYEKINPLMENERKLILPLLARDNCRMFEVFYRLSGGNYLKVGAEAELSCLKWTIEVQKNIARELGW